MSKNTFMSVSADFINSNPSKGEIANYICAVANSNVLEVDETYAWDDLATLGGFTRDDFYDDVQGTYDRYGKEALDVYGIVNWKLKEGRLMDYPMVWEDMKRWLMLSIEYLEERQYDISKQLHMANSWESGRIAGKLDGMKTSLNFIAESEKIYGKGEQVNG